MKYNFVNTNDIEINDNLNMMVYEIGEETKHKVLVIDDFLKNPEDVLSIIETHPFDSAIELVKWGHETHLKFPNIRKVFAALASVYYGVDRIDDSELDEKIKLQFNLINGGIKCPNRCIIPHVDQAHLAFSLFLNPNGNNPGGTGFYKHVKSNVDYDLSYSDEEFKRTEQYWQIHETYRKAKRDDFETIFDSRNISQEDWELQFVADVKFNRLVMHPSYLFHTFYIEKDWYTEEKRLSLAGFLL